MQSRNLKDLIADTLLLLLEKKGLEEISVVDLVNECHVSRQSFYYHYHDLMAVIEYIIEQKVEEAVSITFTGQSLEDEIKLFIDYYFEFYELLQRIFLSPRGLNIYIALVKSVRRIMAQHIDDFATTRSTTPEESELLLDFYAHGVVGFLIERRMLQNQDKNTLVSQIKHILTITPVIF